MQFSATKSAKFVVPALAGPPLVVPALAGPPLVVPASAGPFAFLLLLFLPLLPIQNTHAAAGDILNITIETNGWNALVKLSGMATNGVYNFGIGPTNVVTNSTLSFSVTSMAYDNQALATTAVRTIYATKYVRLPYGWNGGTETWNTPDERVEGDDVVLRVSLSDYVFARDSNITATAQAGLYIAATVTNAPTVALACTNLSYQAYARVLGGWTYPGWYLISNDTYTIRSIAFHRDAQLGRPVRCVEFWGQSSEGVTDTNRLTALTPTSTLGDPHPVPEYVATLTVPATWADGLYITNHFKAYPWIGDESSTLCTTNTEAPGPFSFVGTNDLNRWFEHGHVVALDRTNGFGRCLACVDLANGNDATGVAVQSYSFNPAAPPAVFASAGNALLACQKSNGFWYGSARSNCAASTILLTNGLQHFPGVSPTLVWHRGIFANIQPWPGQEGNVTIYTNNSGTPNQHGGAIRFYGLLFTNHVVACYNTSAEKLWVDRCRIFANGNLWYIGVTNLYFTHNTVSNLNGGTLGHDANSTGAQLVRGNTFAPCPNAVFNGQVFIGNVISNSPAYWSVQRGNNYPGLDHAVVYQNKWLKSSATDAILFSSIIRRPILYGAAVVQNLFESDQATQIRFIGWMADYWFQHSTNMLFHQNTVMGQRINNYYNSHTNVTRWDVLPSDALNLTADRAIKSDFFNEGDGFGRGTNRFGNWPAMHGVGFSDNVFVQTLGEQMTGGFGFYMDFTGLNTWTNRGQATNWFGFVSYKANQGGGGDYHLLSSSPLVNFPTARHLLSYDLDGNTRTTNNNLPGVFIYSEATSKPNNPASFHWRWH